jgi:hypothetical protein
MVDFRLYQKSEPNGSLNFRPALTGNMEDKSMPQAYDFSITTGFAFLPPPSPPRTEREHIEQTIEAHLSVADALIRSLDTADGDADFEYDGTAEPDNDTEPSLGWTADIDQRRAVKSCAFDCHGDGAWADMEAEHDGREPSLGSLDREIDQSRWAEGDRRDMEADYTRFFHGHFAGGACADHEADWQRERKV